jgi:hypothetical protein
VRTGNWQNRETPAANFLEVLTRKAWSNGLILSVRVLPAQSAVVEHDLVPIDVVPETESSTPKPPGSLPGRNPLQLLDGVFFGPIVWIAAERRDYIGENPDEIPVLFHKPFHQPLKMWRSPDEKS